MSMCTSPSACTVRSVRECLANAVSMWSKKGTPVLMSEVPVPSRLMVRDMRDSLVSLLSVAVRGVALISFILQFTDGVNECAGLSFGSHGEAQMPGDRQITNK